MSRLDYNELGALLAGQRGPVHYRCRLYDSSVVGEVGGFIRDIDSAGGQVTMSNFRDHTWELSLARKELTGEILERLGDYVRLFVEARDPITYEWKSFPMGLYKLDPYTATHEAWGSTYALTGRSPEILVADDYAVHGYAVTAGSKILERCREILQTRAGVPSHMVSFPGQDKELTTAMYFDPFQDSSSCAYLRIINSLLNAGGYFALFTDNEGRFTTREIQALGAVEPDAIYTSGGELGGAYRMVVGSIEEEYDLEGFANRVVVYSGDPNQSEGGADPVVGVAQNNDPNSPGSRQNLGRWVQGEPVQLQNIVSQAEANQLAAAELKRQTAANHHATFETLPDPRRQPREDYRIEVMRPDGRGVVGGMWTAVNWTLPLGSPPAPMQHEVNRRARLDVLEAG